MARTGKAPLRLLAQVFGDKFAEVLDFGGKRFGFRGVDGIVFEQVGVFFQRQAAAAGVVDDGDVVAGHKGVDVLAGQLLRQVFRTGVPLGRTTAGLLARKMHLVAVALQHAHGRRVDWRKECFLDAAVEEGDIAAFFAHRGRRLAVIEGTWGDRRQDALHRVEGFRQHVDGAHEPLQANGFVEPHRLSPSA